MKSKNKKIRPITIALLCSILIVTACNNHSETKSEMLALPAEMKVSAEPTDRIEAGLSENMNTFHWSSSNNLESGLDEEAKQSVNKSQSTKAKKIIKDGSLSLKSKELVASKLRLDALIKSLNGYYETENFTNDSYRNAYDLRIRVPSENFEKLLGGIEAGKEEVLNKNISARDVTEEYLDIETRLGTKRAYLQRYRELLSKAANVKDILEIEEQIRVLQEDIESQEGRLKFLADQVAFSSLSVNLFSNKEFVYKPYEEASFFERMKSSLSAGWRGTITFIVAIASTWPLLLLLAAITIFGGKKLKNKFKTKTSANNKQ